MPLGGDTQCCGRMGSHIRATKHMPIWQDRELYGSHREPRYSGKTEWLFRSNGRYSFVTGWYISKPLKTQCREVVCHFGPTEISISRVKRVPTANAVLTFIRSCQCAAEILFLILYRNDNATNAYEARGQIAVEENPEWWIGKGLKEAATQPWETVRNLENAQHSRQPRWYSNSNPQHTNPKSHPYTNLAGREPLPTNRDECRRFQTVFRTMHI